MGSARRPLPECSFDWSEISYELLVGRCVQEVVPSGWCWPRIRPTGRARASGRPAATSGTRSTCCGSGPNGSGPSARILRSASPSGTRTWWPVFVPTTTSLPVVGLIALIDAANAWKDAALDAHVTDHTPHPEAGTIGLRHRAAKCARSPPPSLGYSAHQRASVFRISRHSFAEVVRLLSVFQTYIARFLPPGTAPATPLPPGRNAGDRFWRSMFFSILPEAQ